MVELIQVLDDPQAQFVQLPNGAVVYPPEGFLDPIHLKAKVDNLVGELDLVFRLALGTFLFKAGEFMA